MTILPAAVRARFAPKPGRRTGDQVFRAGAYAGGLLVLALLVGMAAQLTAEAAPSIRKFGPGFFTGTTWDPVAETFGVLPIIYGTLVSSMLALLLAVPVSIGTAIFLSEIAPPWLRGPTSFLVEALAAIPSVVFGLWGMFVLVPWVRDPVERVLSNLSFIPLFDGPQFGFGLLAAGIMLAIMVLPIITAVSRDVLLAVPRDQREAMLALGATRSEAITRAVIPYARSGLVGAIILGLGRALGETMAVTMVIGNGFIISASLFRPSHTIASTIASEFNEATTDLYISALVEAALVLMGITLVVNAIARLLVWRLVRSTGARA